jgi:alpha/beta superfamily hydrolase
MLKRGISVCLFDFSGCGLSEGEYISLGWFEVEDIEAVIKHLK